MKAGPLASASPLRFSDGGKASSAATPQPALRHRYVAKGRRLADGIFDRGATYPGLGGNHVNEQGTPTVLLALPSDDR
jgi:hypothetical protein